MQNVAKTDTVADLEPTIDVCGVEVLEHDLLPLLEWLRDPRGKFFWQYLDNESAKHHNMSSKPPKEIMSLVQSQRDLAAENAFDVARGFPALVKKIAEEL